MKRTITLLFLLLFSITGFSQVELDYSVTPKAQAKGICIKGLSPESVRFLLLYRQSETLQIRSARKAAQAQLREYYGVQHGKVSAIAELAEGHNPQELKDFDVAVNSSAGSIFTVMIPVNRFAELAKSCICKSIDVGHKMTTMLEDVRGNLGINEIYAGMNLPQGYDGSGVVAGIAAGCSTPSGDGTAYRGIAPIVLGTARNDWFTGPAAQNPNNVWGHDKVNAYGKLPVNTPMWLVNAFAMEDGFGSITGGGVVTEGVHTLTAIPNSIYQFVQWEDGVTDNPRTVNVTCDTIVAGGFFPFQINHQKTD